MTARLLRVVALAFGLVLACAHIARAADADTDANVRQTWKLFDYLAVDYSGAVANGAVTSQSEYAEMKEFAETALAHLEALPERGARQDLITQAQQLQAAIAALASPEDVAKLAHGVADSLLAAYPVPVAPAKAPDLARGALLFSQKCAVCHGTEGHGDGPAGLKLNPPPIAFSNHERARQRSLFSLFEVVTQGVAGTPMVSFQKAFPDEDRWALAFRVSSFAGTPELVQEGEALWRDDASLRARFPTLESLARTIEANLATDIGDHKAQAVMAYLRTHPDVIGAGSSNGNVGALALARSQLDASLKAYQAGDAKRAGTLALSAYLDGFEPVEAMLRTQDADLLAQVESGMVTYRSRISAGAPVADVAAQAQTLQSFFDATEKTLASGGDSTAAFLGAFTILVREGIEALLVVVATIGFLRKVERRDVLVYVHAGWIGALVAGLLTWAVAAYFVDINGANRELTEGVSSVFAALVLLGVGIWMHQKSLAGKWQVYLKEKLSAALTKKSAFFLFALSFIAVYREVFETILFYIALWTRGNGGAILAGLLAGIVVLAIIAGVLLRTSRRLPIGQFFAASSLLIAVLAVVLAGKGLAALQEAGVVPAIAVHGPRVDALGIYPSMLPLVAQAVVLVIAVGGYLWNTRSTPPTA